MLREHVSLKDYSNYHIGGSARFFAEPKTESELLEVLAEWRKNPRGSEGVFILGGGTNLLIKDEGFDGLVIKPALTALRGDGVRVTAGAGVNIKDLLAYAINKGLSGLEWAGGLPGTVGGAVRGNAGAFSGEIKDSIEEVVSLVWDEATPERIQRDNAACHFEYRSSIFKQQNGKEIILSATFFLKKGDSEAIRIATEEKIRYRNERHPMEYPSIGSIFKNVPIAQIDAEVTQIDADTIRVHLRSNPRTSAFEAPVKQDPFPVIPAAYLINAAGVKGTKEGDAMISIKHPNFIINTGNATARDVKKLIEFVKIKVKEKFGVVLEEEVMYL